MTILSLRSQIAAAIRLVIQLQRLSDGKRRIVSVSEITGIEGDVIQMQEIYRFNRIATLEDGSIQGSFQATGVRPKFLAELATRGITVPSGNFDPAKVH